MLIFIVPPDVNKGSNIVKLGAKVFFKCLFLDVAKIVM